MVLQHLLDAWPQVAPEDELHVVLGTDAGIVVPPTANTHEITMGSRRSFHRLRAQATVLPRLCRTLEADVLLAAIPATTLNRLPCPRVVIAHDLRHELRPEQFAPQARLLRRVSHGLGFRQADAIVTVSKRTRDDLIASRPWLAARIVRPAPLGGDHVDRWPAAVPGPPYAITFGQWGNKNVDLVVDAWKLLQASGDALPLVVVGLAASARERLQTKVAALGLTRSFLAAVAQRRRVPRPLRLSLAGRVPVGLRRLRIARSGGDAPRHPAGHHPDPALLEVPAAMPP